MCVCMFMCVWVHMCVGILCGLYCVDSRVEGARVGMHCVGVHMCVVARVWECVRVLVCFSRPGVQLPTCAYTLGDLNTVSTKGKATSVGE